MSFVYSANSNMFYPHEYQSLYEASGDWPSDGIDVDEPTFVEFTGAAPNGKVRGSGPDGMPLWVDVPSASNSEKLSAIMSTLAEKYKADIFDLNMAYVAAVVNDGTSEAGKVAAVRDQLTVRKAQYMADIAAARAQYPVE